MASTERETGQSRRERRRAEQAKDVDETGEPSPDSSDDDAEQGSSALQALEVREEAEDQVSRPAERIKDRNQRLRARAREERLARQTRKEQAPNEQGLEASEIVDDILSRFTHGTYRWLRQNSGLVQGVVLAALVGGIGWQIYNWQQGKKIQSASEVLMQAVRAQEGVVVSAEEPIPEGLADLKQTFSSDDELLRAAKTGYEAALNAHTKGVSALARVGLAGALFAQGKFDEALKAYEEVKASPLASKDLDSKGRALEGIAMSLEGKGEKEAALKAYRELENAALPGFVDLALYHQARLHVALGEVDKAKELLLKVKDHLKDNKDLPDQSYIRQVSMNLLRAVDPSTPAPEMDSARLQEILEQLKAQGIANPGGGDAPGPVPRAPGQGDAPPSGEPAP